MKPARRTMTAAVASNERPALGVVRRVAVFRALQLGDLLCSVPALRALRTGLPQAVITLIGLPWAATFAQRFSCYVDRFLAFPGTEGLPEQENDPVALDRFFALAHAQRFDLALQMHGNGAITNGVVGTLGARVSMGFCRPDSPNPDPQRLLPYPEADSEIWRQLRLMAFLGLPLQGDALEFPISPEEHRCAMQLMKETGLKSGEYVCVHPGARAPARRWPTDRFADVAGAIADLGLSVVLTGSAGEAALTRLVHRQMRRRSIDLAGRTSLGTVAALISRAKLLISNDTGVSHIAAALRVPSVIVYSGSSPARWAPANRLLHRAAFHEVSCRPCSHYRCPIGHPCARELSAEQVREQALALLNSLGKHQCTSQSGS